MKNYQPIFGSIFSKFCVRIEKEAKKVTKWLMLSGDVKGHRKAQCFEVSVYV
jgi:hypothetical protein